MLASRHPGLELKILCYCALYSATQWRTRNHSHLSKMHTCDNVRQTQELTNVIGHVNTHSHLWKFANWRFVCRGLTVIRSSAKNVRSTGKVPEGKKQASNQPNTCLWNHSQYSRYQASVKYKVITFLCSDYFESVTNSCISMFLFHLECLVYSNHV